MGVFKGESTKRPAPPHPQNSGSEALRGGVKALEANQSESASKPDRKNQTS